jgi:hypothetical protein
MAKKSAAAQAKQLRASVTSGWFFALASTVFSLILMLSVVQNVFDRVNSGLVDAPNSLAIVMTVLLAGLSLKWEPEKSRPLVLFALGVAIASCLIWQFGLH